MKKTAISLILALAMVMSFVLVAAPQAEAAAHTNHCVCGGKAAGVGDHTTCTTVSNWADLNAYVADPANTDADGKLTVAAGNYYLSGELNLPSVMYFAENATVTICLNGQKLKGNAVETAGKARCLNIGVVATVNICDCQGGGQMSSTSTSNGAVISIGSNVGATLNLYSGTIIGSPNSTSPGSAFRFQGGTVNMYAVVIKDGVNNGASDAAKAGGNVCLSKGCVMTMYGGTIENGTAAKGSNVYLMDTSVLNVLGGTITGGKNSDDIMAIGKSTVKFVKLAGTTKATTSGGEATLNFDELDSSVTKTQSLLTYTLVGPAASTPSTPSNPGTGDSANLVVMGLGLVLGVAGIACLLPKKQEI